MRLIPRLRPIRSLGAVLGLSIGAAAQAAPQIPDYFFQQWSVGSNCAEAHAGLAAHVDAGLVFAINRNSAQADGSYTLQAIDGPASRWLPNWNGLKLQYRPGTPMTTVPADFACVPGATSSSPFLAMAGYVQSPEPYYPQEHWYGLATLFGQLEHVLIFPRDVSGDGAAIIVLQSASAPTDLTLDDNGVIIGHK